MKSPLPLSEAKTDAVCIAALADSFKRHIAELTRTQQPGGKALIRKLKSAVRELRAKSPATNKNRIHKCRRSIFRSKQKGHLK